MICPRLGQAAVANVSVGDDFFNPPSVTINVNDQVKWTWAGNLTHSSTSTTALWDSGPIGHNSTYSHPFTTPGSFPYYCTVHTFQTGTVTVQAAANVPPTVAVTNPPNGLVLSAPATIALAARASDSDGTVANVQFLQGTASLTNVASSPYSVLVGNLGAGDYTFSAVATDNGALRATNAIVVHVVTPVPVVLSAVQRPSRTNFQFSYSANLGLTYVVQRASDFQHFTPINTNTAAGNPVIFLDNGASGAVNFYRVGRLPNT